MTNDYIEICREIDGKLLETRLTDAEIYLAWQLQENRALENYILSEIDSTWCGIHKEHAKILRKPITVNEMMVDAWRHYRNDASISLLEAADRVIYAHVDELRSKMPFDEYHVVTSLVDEHENRVDVYSNSVTFDTLAEAEEFREKNRVKLENPEAFYVPNGMHLRADIEVVGGDSVIKFIL